MYYICTKFVLYHLTAVNVLISAIIRSSEFKKKTGYNQVLKNVVFFKKKD